MKSILFVALCAIAALVGQPPVAAAQEGTAMVLETHPELLVVETDRGEVTFTVEIADTPERRSAGLMFRKTMPDGHGMLFDFGRTARVSMWMKNTLIPLDMVFIDAAGRINAIRDARPLSLDVIAPRSPVRFVLELNAGTTTRHGIAIGQRVDHPVINAIAGSK